MSRPKKTKTVVMTKSKARAMEDELTYKIIILTIAYLMDEFNYSDDAICDFWDGMVRYLDAIDQKLITVDKVRKIIKEHTGMEIFKDGKC